MFYKTALLPTNLNSCSSSGTYSGGDPVEMELSQKQHEDVIRALVNLLNDSSTHVAARTMGTGIITVSDSATSKRVIINNSCCSNVDKTLRSITKQTARHIPD